METGFNRFLAWVINGYRQILSFNERHRTAALAVLALAVLMLLHAMTLAGKVGFTFVSEPDRAELFVKLEYPTWYNLGRTTERVRIVEERLRDVPELEHMLSSLKSGRDHRSIDTGGVSGPGASDVFRP